MLGNMSPPKRRCVSSTLVGTVQYSLKMLGEAGLVSLGFPILMFQIVVPVTQRGLVERSKIACEIHIVGTIYGHLLWRNLVNMLALLGPWPGTPLVGEVLKDFGLSFVLRHCVKG